ncbi:hypothetical protein [Geobacillus sp. DSP4a]|nr:hypothetical protein [Geobacillus sp. DSP4a]
MEGKPLPMDLFRENARAWIGHFHARVEGKTLPMDLFRENTHTLISHLYA